MVDKETLSYKRGFAKGIEIYAQNLSKGYYADEDNKKCVGAFKHYAETGFKKGIRLNDGQRQYFYGMADGIEYKYKQGGTPLIKEKKRIKKQSAKALNITTIVLEILFEIILLPLHICNVDKNSLLSSLCLLCLCN